MSPNKAVDPNITAMLREWKDGRPDAVDELLPLIYDELRRRAAAFMRRERPDHTLQPTALVHEAWLKLLDQHGGRWNDREHFFAIASKVMRRILVDHAKGRHRKKRGGLDENMPLDESVVAVDLSNTDLIALDEALSRLAGLEKQQVQLVELRYFAGLTLEEAAKAMGVSRATAAREWQMAKAWLHREMTRTN
jgi:RNA polymerase sigma-70 factor, ECF subfamily